MSAEEAYQEAVRRIDEAAQTKAQRLILADLDDLETLPPEIGSLTELRTLDLDSTKISNLVPLQQLTNLVRLSLGGTQITDLTPLQSLKGLQELYLTNTQIADLVPLQGLVGLHTLHLNNTQITDITPLQGLTGLQLLYLNNTKITDLAPLENLSELKMLYIVGTEVSDLSPIPSLTMLRKLYLNRTAIADLRPVLSVPSLLEATKEGTEATGVNFWITPAVNADPILAEIAEIEDSRERTERLFEHLKTLPPWPEPLNPPSEEFADGEIPNAPDTSGTPRVVALDGKIDVDPSPPGDDELADPIRERLYQQLPAAAQQLYNKGNRWLEVFEPARVLRDLTEVPFEDADILSIHLQVAALIDVRNSNPDRPESEQLDSESLAALQNLLRIGPGVTIGHPDVEILEERVRESERRQLPENIGENERDFADSLAKSDLTTPRAKTYAKTVAQSSEGGRVAEIGHDFVRKAIVALGTLAGALGNAAAGYVPGLVVGEAVEFILLHAQTILAIAPSWGEAGVTWAEYLIAKAKEIASGDKED